MAFISCFKCTLFHGMLRCFFLFPISQPPGNTGVAVMLYDPRKSSVSKIERESGVKFEHISAPQPADIAKAAGVEAAETITQVSDRYTCYVSSLRCLSAAGSMGH